MKRTTIALELAKTVFEVAVSHQPGRVAKRLRLSRAKLTEFFAHQPPATVLMEACGSAHHWARQLQTLGHSVVLLPPRHVRPYRHGNKTDRADAKALLEAFRNDEILPVPVKSVEQQTLAALHRLRSGWIATRTARINAVRGILRELGLTIPLGPHHLLPRVGAWIAQEDSPLPEALRPALAASCDEIRELEGRIRDLERQLKALARQIPAVASLRTIPGIGLLTATALVAFVGDVHRFASGRHLASFVGLTPKEHSSGNTRRLGRISKRGDPYLRTLLIHGARSVLWSAKNNKQPDHLRRWALNLEITRGHNKAAVALANKLARFAWVVLKEQRDFHSTRRAA